MSEEELREAIVAWVSTKSASVQDVVLKEFRDRRHVQGLRVHFALLDLLTQGRLEFLRDTIRDVDRGGIFRVAVRTVQERLF